MKWYFVFLVMVLWSGLLALNVYMGNYATAVFMGALWACLLLREVMLIKDRL